MRKLFLSIVLVSYLCSFSFTIDDFKSKKDKIERGIANVYASIQQGINSLETSRRKSFFNDLRMNKGNSKKIENVFDAYLSNFSQIKRQHKELIHEIILLRNCKEFKSLSKDERIQTIRDLVLTDAMRCIDCQYAYMGGVSGCSNYVTAIANDGGDHDQSELDQIFYDCWLLVFAEYQICLLDCTN
jgi:hypothetical protein